MISRHDETERFRDLGAPVRTERRGADVVTVFDRPGGDQVVTVVDPDGRLLRRVRRFPDGREVVIINNTFRGPPRPLDDDIVDVDRGLSSPLWFVDSVCLHRCVFYVLGVVQRRLTVVCVYLIRPLPYVPLWSLALWYATCSCRLPRRPSLPYALSPAAFPLCF